VPWIPITAHNRQRFVSGRVAHFTYDQFTTLPALDQIALQPGTSPRSYVVAPHPSGVPAIPAGVYRTTVKTSDLRRFGAPAAEVESSGTLTLTIARGTWRSEISGPRRYFAPVHLGHYWGAGDTVTFRVEKPLPDAIVLPRMRWTTEGDRLRFHLLGCGALANAPGFCAADRAKFEAHPWVKVR
jgi:hypothetical protein